MVRATHHRQLNTAGLEADVMRFMAIIAFCLIAMMALVKDVEPQIEKFIVALLTPNLRRVNEGLQRFLDSLEPQMHKEAP